MHLNIHETDMANVTLARVYIPHRDRALAQKNESRTRRLLTRARLAVFDFPAVNSMKKIDPSNCLVVQDVKPVTHENANLHDSISTQIPTEGEFRNDRSFLYTTTTTYNSRTCIPSFRTHHPQHTAPSF